MSHSRFLAVLLRFVIVSLPLISAAFCQADQEATSQRLEKVRQILISRTKEESQFGESNPLAVRIEAIEIIGSVWRREEWVKELLTQLIEDKAQRKSVRLTAMRQILADWKTDVWVRDLLISLVSSEEKEQTIRQQAMFYLGTRWGRQDWLKNLLVPIVSSPDEDWGTRQQAISMISNVWGRVGWARDLFLRLSATGANEDIRFRAQHYLKIYYPEVSFDANAEGRQSSKTEQIVPGQPAIRAESASESGQNRQPESEGSSQ